MAELAREAAYKLIVSSLDVTKSFPDQVFKGDDFEFRFFESDQMFAPSFVDVVMQLLSIEKAKSSCLLNLSRTEILTYSEAVAIFLEFGITGADYNARLQRGGPAESWFASMDHYACASDVGNWIMYCERNNDVAVVALRGRSAADRFSGPLRKVHAEAIDVLIHQGSAALIPFCDLVPSWRNGLSSHYGTRAK